MENKQEILEELALSNILYQDTTVLRPENFEKQIKKISAPAINLENEILFSIIQTHNEIGIYDFGNN